MDKLERDINFYIIDTLAHEYGWTVEYIESLTIPEVHGLIETIQKRKDTEDLRMQLNVAKGMMGKVSSNFTKEEEVPNDPHKEVQELEKLAKALKVPIKKVKTNG